MCVAGALRACVFNSQTGRTVTTLLACVNSVTTLRHDETRWNFCPPMSQPTDANLDVERSVSEATSSMRRGELVHSTFSQPPTRTAQEAGAISRCVISELAMDDVVDLPVAAWSLEAASVASRTLTTRATTATTAQPLSGPTRGRPCQLRSVGDPAEAELREESIGVAELLGDRHLRRGERA
jgi:hypothetical protein